MCQLLCSCILTPYWLFAASYRVMISILVLLLLVPHYWDKSIAVFLLLWVRSVFSWLFVPIELFSSLSLVFTFPGCLSGRLYFFCPHFWSRVLLSFMLFLTCLVSLHFYVTLILLPLLPLFPLQSEFIFVVFPLHIPLAHLLWLGLLTLFVLPSLVRSCSAL